MIYPKLVKIFINQYLRDISVLFKQFIIQMILPFHLLFSQLFWFIIPRYSSDYSALFVIHYSYSLFTGFFPYLLFQLFCQIHRYLVGFFQLLIIQ